MFSVGVLQHLPINDATKVLQKIRDHLLLGGEALLYESLIGSFAEEAEAMYLDTDKHLIPKPITILKEKVPELIWKSEGDFKYILKRRPNET